jgi:hypothetical protein
VGGIDTTFEDAIKGPKDAVKSYGILWENRPVLVVCQIFGHYGLVKMGRLRRCAIDLVCSWTLVGLRSPVRVLLTRYACLMGFLGG